VVTFGPGGDVHFDDARRARPGPDRHVIVAGRRPARARLPSTRATTCSTPWPPSRPPGRGVRPSAAWTCARGAPRLSACRSPAGATVITTATTPARCPCEPPWTISRRRCPPDGASRCSATCSSSGRRARAPPGDRKLRGGVQGGPADRGRPTLSRDARPLRR
jgi:hypothetical protein